MNNNVLEVEFRDPNTGDTAIEIIPASCWPECRRAAEIEGLVVTELEAA